MRANPIQDKKQSLATLVGARRGLVVACCAALIICLLSQQAGGARAQTDLSVRASFDANVPVTADAAIELRLSRALKSDEGRIAVVIGRADMTGLFIINGTRLVYSPALVPLPLGESRVAVYLVRADGSWLELAHFTLQVIKEKPAPAPT